MGSIEDLGQSVESYGTQHGTEGKSFIAKAERRAETEKGVEAAVSDRAVIVLGLLAICAWLGRDYRDEATAYWDQAWAWLMELITPLRNVSPGSDVPTPASEAPVTVSLILFALTLMVGAIGQDWLRWVLRPHGGLFGAVLWLGAAMMTVTLVTVLATATVGGTLGCWTAAGIMGGHMARTHYQARKP